MLAVKTCENRFRWIKFIKMTICIIYVPVYGLWPMIGAFVCVMKFANIGRICFSLYRKEHNPSKCIFCAYSATSATFLSQVVIEPPNHIYLVFSPRVIYENVATVFIEINRICKVFWKWFSWKVIHYGLRKF